MRPENNANVLIWKAIGPNPAGVTMPSGYFERMGIKSPPAVGDYFVPLRRYIETNRPAGLDSPEQWRDTLHRLVISPWTAGQHADINAWLQANERPLATVLEATKRTRYYSPVIPPRNVDGSRGILNAPLPNRQVCHEMAVARCSVRYAGDGSVDAAWQDLLACHRLVRRLVAQGGSSIEALVGMAIDQIASRADLAFLDFTRPIAKQINAYLTDLQAQLPFPDVSEIVDLTERFMFLDIIMTMDGHGVAQLLRDGERGSIRQWLQTYLPGMR